MTQEEIDTLKESEIREAVEAAEATVRERSPDDGTASRALQAYRLARQTLRGNDA
jgi:hypothetical protein